MTDLVKTPGDALSQQRSLLPDAERRAKRRKHRMLKDGISRWGITAAGFGVVFSLALIFVYLFYEVMPILRGAQVTPSEEYVMPGLAGEAEISHLVLDRYSSMGVNYADDGVVTFFEASNGTVRDTLTQNFPAGVEVTTFAKAEDRSHLVSYGLSNGQAAVLKHEFDLSYPDGQRYITPVISYPFGESPVTVAPDGQPLQQLAIQQSDRGTNRLGLAGYADGDLHYVLLTARENMLTGAVTVQERRVVLPDLPAEPVKILLDKTLRSLFVADAEGMLHYYDIQDLNNPELTQSISVGEQENITAMDFLVGTVSLIVGTDTGGLSQWFLVRDEHNSYALERVRDFKSHSGAITQISPEYNRKGFMVGDASGGVGIHYGTSARTLYLEPFYDRPVSSLAISPRNNRMLTVDQAGK
ncbi:MAG: hypothetical protein WED11_05535 [Natronospirillum sp.]